MRVNRRFGLGLVRCLHTFPQKYEKQRKFRIASRSLHVPPSPLPLIHTPPWFGCHTAGGFIPATDELRSCKVEYNLQIPTDCAARATSLHALWGECHSVHALEGVANDVAITCDGSYNLVDDSDTTHAGTIITFGATKTGCTTTYAPPFSAPPFSSLRCGMNRCTTSVRVSDPPL
jgi:hypothetical protein